MFRLFFATCMPAIFALFLGACSSGKKLSITPETAVEPTADREFRAAWVATVANINWPSKPGLSTADQQREALEILDFLKEHRFNAVIFQVRPQADALYESQLEPWSYFLTGTQGKAPDPWYDPLDFWVEAAHDRGLELHVWLNPYRAHHVSGGEVSENSIVKQKPELVLHLKEGYWWFDPSLQETQDHGVQVVMDIVKRYDIDGVHFDDYFYPYLSYNKNEDFPDTASRRRYLEQGGKLSLGDWRRESVNRFIKRLYTEIKQEKKHVKFGLSPFGIWRPKNPPSIAGMDQYSELYADAKLWLNEGWIDYFSPQLYWPIGRIQQSFPVLLGWWASQNKQGRHLWPGISVGRDTSAKTTTETLNQIMISRGMLPSSPGVVHWSVSSVTKNPAMASMLAKGPYALDALVPVSPWLSGDIPKAPELSIESQKDSTHLSWTHEKESDIFKWVVYYEYGPTRGYQILTRGERAWTLPNTVNQQKLTRVAVTAVNRSSLESPRTERQITL